MTKKNRSSSRAASATAVAALALIAHACRNAEVPAASPTAAGSAEPMVIRAPGPGEAAAAPPLELASSAPSSAPAPREVVDAPRGPLQVVDAQARCAPSDWSPRSLGPLLAPGKKPRAEHADSAGASVLLFDRECTDTPGGPSATSHETAVVDGVELRVTSATPAGTSRRGWGGNQCALDVRLADGSGAVTHLGVEEIPPFNTVNAVVRAGSAAWIAVSFNGYTAEFPGGGNRVIAVDLCGGRVVWESPNSTSNGGLLLLDDYLISPYGFTNERRFVFVLDARSGRVVQKLPVVENVCPSERWAPHWDPGDPCDAPGQRVGAATNPRVKDGLLLVDTNTGSAAFSFR